MTPDDVRPAQSNGDPDPATATPIGPQPTVLATDPPGPQFHASLHDLTAPDLAELVRLKEPFVLRDFVSRSESASRNMAAINSLRNWQVTLTGGLVVFAYSQRPPGWLAFGVLVLTSISFLMLEANEHVYADHAEKGLVKCEQSLSAKSLEDFRRGIRDWQFGGIRARQELTKKVRRARWRSRMRKPWILLWHVLVLLLSGLALSGLYRRGIADVVRSWGV